MGLVCWDICGLNNNKDSNSQFFSQYNRGLEGGTAVSFRKLCYIQTPARKPTALSEKPSTSAQRSTALSKEPITFALRSDISAGKEKYKKNCLLIL